MNKHRGSFTGGIGFVLAAAGSAVGLGNLWRFPYLAAQYGGGIFILVYIILAVTFGFALMTTEIAIGRKTGKSPIHAYGELDKRFAFLGKIATIVPIIILPYYSVIGGWVLKYVTVYLTSDFEAAAQNEYFGNFIGDVSAPLVFFAIFLLITAVIVRCGVKSGIEKMSKILMPLLFVMIVGICIYIISLPGSVEGIKYYLLPDLSKFSVMTVCAAMGQMFYSMSIAMGIMITYGSYMKKETNLIKSVGQIEIFDSVIAILAGLMIIPVVYMFSGEEGTRASGAGLMFISLPKIFEQMVGGKALGLLFFILVLFAALTSAVSILEAITSSLMDRFNVTRGRACAIATGISIVLGIPSSLGNGLWSHITVFGMDFLTFFDYLSNSVLMPIVALTTCVLVGWVIGTNSLTDEITRNGEKFSRKILYEVMTKYIAPLLLIVILVVYSLAQFGIVTM